MTNLIFIHGVSSQTTGYSNRFYNNIIKSYKSTLVKKRKSKQEARAKARELIQKEILWADVTTNLTNRYMFLQYKLKKKPGKWNFFLKSIDPLVIQILHYVKDKRYKTSGMNILKKVDNAFKTICSDKSDKVIVIAHSLGSVVAFDYIFGFRKYKIRPKINVEALITLGCPVPLFTSAMGHVESKITLPKNVKRWINILDPDDGVGRFCKPFFKNVKVQDITINTGFGPLGSHSKYWKSRKVADLIAGNLVKWGI